MKIQDLSYTFSAAVPIAAISSPAPEELSTIALIVNEVAKRLNFPTYVWDFSRETLEEVLFDPSGAGIQSNPIQGFLPQGFSQQDKLNDILDFIGEYKEKALFILVDVHPFLEAQSTADLQAALSTIRRVKSLYFALKRTKKRLIFLSQEIQFHGDLVGLIREVQNPLPSAIEINERLTFCFTQMREEMAAIGKDFKVKLATEERDRLIRSCQGLTLEEIYDLIREQIKRQQKPNGNCQLGLELADAINHYKTSKMRRYQVEFSEPPDVPIGGLNLLKDWFGRKVKLFTQEARKYHLPYPKGAVLVGPPGSGKTLCARTLQQQWGVPMFQVNIGALMGSLVGESERNVRHLLQVAEACSPCILFIDEIDKSGLSATSADTDGGTSRRVLQSLLSWMSDRTTPVFVIATANRIEGSGLPPEFFRKGRFDSIFVVDLPQFSERIAIAKIHLNKMGMQLTDEELKKFAIASIDFSGAEIAGVINTAAEMAFDLGRPGEVTIEDLLLIVKEEIPLATREKEAIEMLRQWAKTYARPASAPELEPTGESRSLYGMLDFESN